MVDTNVKYKMKKNLTVTDLSGEKVMIDYDTGKYFMIRGAGNEIWELLEKGEKSFSEIVDALLAEYEVSREECETSVRQFLGEMEKYGFI